MLMNYETFKEKLRKEVLRLLPKEMVAEGYKVEFLLKYKVNVMDEAIVIRSDNESCSPAISLALLYEQLNECSVEDLAKKLVDSYLHFLCTGDDLHEEVLNGLSINNLYLVVVNTSWNPELLNSVPHRNFLNLSAVYRIRINDNTNGISSTLVTYEMMKWLGVSSEEVLYQRALVNTKRLFPFRIGTMESVLDEMYGLTERQVDPADEDLNMQLQNVQQGSLLILTNNKGINGSSILLYPDLLKLAADALKCEKAIILPSSIHEILMMAMPSSIDGIGNMVREINATQVKDSERLSDQFYIFDVRSSTLSIVDEEKNADLQIDLDHMANAALVRGGNLR